MFHYKLRREVKSLSEWKTESLSMVGHCGSHTNAPSHQLTASGLLGAKESITRYKKNI